MTASQHRKTGKSNISNKDKGNKKDFRHFLLDLERQNELVRISRSVDSKFELAAVVSALDGKQAVIFENIKDGRKSIKVAGNVSGTRKRFAQAIGADDLSSQSIQRRIMSAISSKMLPSEVSHSSEAPFYENSSNNLFDLPVVTHFEKDAGAFITSSIVFARDIEAGNQNSSTHRLLRIDDRHMAIRMVEGRHLHKCFMGAKEHGEDLKISISVGVHPAVSIAAAYQAAYGVDEMIIANYLLDGGLDMTRSVYSGLLVPFHSEIVLEGKILSDRTHEEWMVEMLRTYDFKRKQPVFELDSIHFRNDAIFHDILPGYMEHRLLMGMPVETKIFEGVKNVVPTTKIVHLSDGGSNWLCAVISIHKRLEGEPKNALLAAFASHPSLKMAIVVDDDIDPTDPVAVEYAISTRSQADRDYLIIPNTKGSSLDPSSDQQNLLTTKVGIDATASVLKPRERFEIARIPGQEKIILSEYFKFQFVENQGQ